MSKNQSCFGFFAATRICEGCPLKIDCKHVLVFCGFDIIKAAQYEMENRLPEGNYIDSDRIPVLTDQVTGVKLPGQDDETLKIFDDLQNDEIDLSKVV